MNALTGARVLVADQLFATLDPTTRRLELPGGRRATLSDTVGFVGKLPHDLVEAFRSTLEEVTLADLVLHVADAASPDLEEQIDAVRRGARRDRRGRHPGGARAEQDRPGRRARRGRGSRAGSPARSRSRRSRARASRGCSRSSARRCRTRRSR